MGYTKKRELYILQGHRSDYCLAITSDGKYIISSSVFGVIRLWNLNDIKN